MYTCEHCEYSTQIKYNYTRHLNKKVKCCKKVAIIANICPEYNESFIKIADGRWKCVTCTKSISTNSKKHHFNVACRRGLSVLHCMYCNFLCDNRFSKSRHQKRCKLDPQQSSEPQARSSGLTVPANTTININNIENVIQTQNININITNNIAIHFGTEELDYLLENKGDPRIQHAFRNLLDTIDLVHFNQDHPDNHTVRKLNKKSDLIEFKTNNRWEPESCTTGLPKLKHNLESRLKTKFENSDDLMSGNKLKELLYHKSKRGCISVNDILDKYSEDTLESLDKLKCLDECVKITEHFKKTVSQNIQKTQSAVIYLKNQLNCVRTNYNIELLTNKDIIHLL